MDGRTGRARQCHDSAMKCYNIAARKAQKKNLTVREYLARPILITLFNISRSVPFYYMGRSLTEQLLEFVLKERGRVIDLDMSDDEALPSGWDCVPYVPMVEPDVYGFSFITGSSGAGKTYSLAAAGMYLHVFFSKERATKGSQASASNGDGPDAGVKRRRIDSAASKRIAFVEGAAFAARPAAAIWNAFFLAFLDDEGALQKLEAQDSQTVTLETIENFLFSSSVPGEVILVVDDGNKVDRSAPQVAILTSLLGHIKVVFCVSISRMWIGAIRHPKTTDYKIVEAAMDDTEYKCFKRLFLGANSGPVAETGRVPRLLQQYKHDHTEFINTIGSLQRGLDDFFTELKQSNWRRVFGELAGVAPVWMFPDLLETKCFYRGADGRLKCLSSDLRAYALSRVAELVKEDYAEICFWCNAVCGDDNIIRIGWNTELVTLLAAKLLELRITYATGKEFTMTTRVFNCFRGQMNRSKLSNPPQGTLHAPEKFNHAGLNFYYEDDKMIVAIQVSVGLQAQAHHPGTVKLAEEIFSGDERIKVLLWVMYTDIVVSQHVTTATGLSYYSVTMPFAHFCPRLACIDEKLKKLRRLTSEPCSECLKGGEGVQCDSCDAWYHQSC